MTKRTATPAEAGATAPATPVQTPARKEAPPRPRDAHTGQGGCYERDPVTGIRTRLSPDDAAASEILS
ncbi:MAG: hypothetical protein JWR74_411 [Polaromonas sp.]|nr:hypothetical protein [Polaromonas sp.]